MEALLRRHHQRIWAVCRRLAGNDADASDACQEAMVLVVRRLDTFDGRSAFTTWVHRVATNATLDELRRRRRRPEPAVVQDLGTDDRRSGPRVPDEGVDFATSVADSLRLQAALTELPEAFRIPVVLRDVVGHDYAEIAEILGIPPGTVRSRIARGRAQLADALGGGDGPGNPAPSAERRTGTP